MLQMRAEHRKVINAEDSHLRDYGLRSSILFCGLFVTHRVASCNMTLHPQPFTD